MLRKVLFGFDAWHFKYYFLYTVENLKMNKANIKQNLNIWKFDLIAKELITRFES